MSNLSPNNRIINSINRTRYIDKLRGNIGAIKENNRTPIHHKFMDTYEDLTSNIPKRYIFIFISILIITCVILYYFKPSFILKNNQMNNQLKISSNKLNKKTSDDKVVNNWKLILYSSIITIIIYSILYFMRTKINFIGKLFDVEY